MDRKWFYVEHNHSTNIQPFSSDIQPHVHTLTVQRHSRITAPMYSGPCAILLPEQAVTNKTVIGPLHGL